MQSDVIPDAALCERLRSRVLPGRISEMSDGTRALDPLCQSAADRLESLSRQLSDAQRERDDLRAAVSAARAELGELRCTVERSSQEMPGAYNPDWAIGYCNGIDASMGALYKHTEGGEP